MKMVPKHMQTLDPMRDVKRASCMEALDRHEKGWLHAQALVHAHLCAPRGGQAELEHPSNAEMCKSEQLTAIPTAVEPLPQNPRASHSPHISTTYFYRNQSCRAESEEIEMSHACWRAVGTVPWTASIGGTDESSGH